LLAQLLVESLLCQVASPVVEMGTIACQAMVGQIAMVMVLF